MSKIPIHKYTENIDPIFSIGAGYQAYYPFSKKIEPYTDGSTRRDTMAKKDSQILYYKTSPTGGPVLETNLLNASPVLGFYAGNRILSERYKDVEAGYLTQTESDQLINSFKGRYAGKALPILETYLGSTTPNFTGTMAKGIKTANVPAGEEQFKAVGGRKPAKGKFGAQPIDIANAPHFGNIQVTTERIDKNKHHGIYGAAGKALGKEVRNIKQKHRRGIIDRDTMHTRIAKEGLNYFKQRIPTWNTALATVRKELIKQKQRPTARNMASTIRGNNPVKVISDMALHAQHFTQQKSATIVLQAIGNLRYFGTTGVTYSYAIGPMTHVAFSKFFMNPSSFQFDLAKLNMAEVVDGTYDVTDMFISQASSALSTMDVSMKRAFAHNNFRITQSEQTIDTNSLNAGHVGGQLANHSRFMASIDMFHASKDMHDLITKGIIPEVREAFDREAGKYTSQNLMKHRGSIKFGDRGKSGWALPYISVFDTKLEKTGQR